MATLYITVWDSAGSTALGDPLQEMAVTIGVASADSAAVTGVSKARKTVRLYADADCSVTWGAAPTAIADGTSGRAIGADNPEYFNIESGHIIAVITRA